MRRKDLMRACSTDTPALSRREFSLWKAPSDSSKFSNPGMISASPIATRCAAGVHPFSSYTQPLEKHEKGRTKQRRSYLEEEIRAAGMEITEHFSQLLQVHPLPVLHRYISNRKINSKRYANEGNNRTEEVQSRVTSLGLHVDVGTELDQQ